MADFDPPFGTSGEWRQPTPTEVTNGMPCGPADRTLFNGMFRRIEAELGSVITAAGIAQTNSRDTLVLEAINALISAATGGNPAGYILMTQARARLPIFPEVLNSDGRIVITAPSTGTVRLPGGVTFQHRGIFQVTTAQTDFLTDPSKTYHLRWDPTNGFTLKDVANATYNPSSLVETNAVFDSSYDDMLVARIITNSSNIATITNLANKDRNYFEEERGGNATIFTYGNGSDGLTYTDTSVTNWARTPRAFITGVVNISGQALMNGVANRINARTTTRYGTTATIIGDWDRVLTGNVCLGMLHFQQSM